MWWKRWADLTTPFCVSSTLPISKIHVADNEGSVLFFVFLILIPQAWCYWRDCLLPLLLYSSCLYFFRRRTVVAAVVVDDMIPCANLFTLLG